ncbi:MAG: PQQ-dependent sugar dehydrogenase [Bacteroidota bacterium]
MRYFPLLVLLAFGCAEAPQDASTPGSATEQAPTTPVALTGNPMHVDTDLPLEQIVLPEGFEISVYADDLPNARSLRLTENGTLFVSTRRDGRVYAVVGDTPETRRTYTIAADLNMPNGLAFRDGSLYVAEVSRLLRYDNIESQLADPPAPVVVYEDLPTDTHHGWKYIDFGPDGKLYVPVGAPCNVCDREEPYATLMRMNADGTDREIVAYGVRNTVGFNWHPENGDLYFTDNGRDLMGDDLPPCEFNRVTEIGQHYGYPYVHGSDILDPEFGQGRDPEAYVEPIQNLGPHVAPLGFEFYNGAQFPETYKGHALIAEHGSWNRSKKIGYRVMLVGMDEAGNATSYEPFAEGWLQGQEDWGRPVDLEHLPDGSVLVSDDKAGVVYRIAYTG